MMPLRADCFVLLRLLQDICWETLNQTGYRLICERYKRASRYREKQNGSFVTFGIRSDAIAIPDSDTVRAPKAG
jgi:hypothetical protein